MKSGFFGPEALYSGQNAAAVEKSVASSGVLLEVTAKANYVAPVTSVSELYTGLLFEDITFADALPLLKYFSDPEM